MQLTQTFVSHIEHLTFGVELETTIPATSPISVGGYHFGVAVAAENAPTFQGRHWKAERDGSIRCEPGYQACEFVSPVLQGEAGVKHLIEFVEYVNRMSGKVNASCGMHVHIGLRPFSPDAKTQAKFVKILARLVTRNATALYAQTGTLSRESGTYCKRLSDESRKNITRACRKARVSDAAASNDRYLLLNLQPVLSKGTVEFRCFAGTLNVAKILCHLVSVFSLVLVAAKRKSLTAWDPAEILTGQEALTNLLKARPAFDIVGAEVFQSRKREILAKGFEMAAKYDQARVPFLPAPTQTQGGGAIE